MTLWEQIRQIARSRKFWALLAGVLAAVASHATGEITVWQMLQAVLAALAIYTTGVALEDNRAGRAP